MCRALNVQLCAHIQSHLQDVFRVDGSDQMLVGENPKIIKPESCVELLQICLEVLGKIQNIALSREVRKKYV